MFKLSWQFSPWFVLASVLALAGCPAEPVEPIEAVVCPDFSQGPVTLALLDRPPSEAGPLGTAIVTSEELFEADLGRKFQITYPACADATLADATPADATPAGDHVMPAGKWPVIVFSHAQNDRRHEIYQAYERLHRHWASWGYVVLSVDNAEENRKKVEREGTAQENLQDRSDWQRAGIDLLEALAGADEGVFAGALDLDKIIVAGHSRGGGASMLTARNDRRVKAMLLFQAIDPQSFGHGQVRVEVPSMGFTAGLDDDVVFPRADANEDLLVGSYVWVDILGGIHAYTTDDIPLRKNDAPLISRKEQLDLSGLFSVLFLFAEVPPEGFVFEGGRPKPLIYGHTAEAIAASIATPGARTRWQSRGETTVLIDDFEFERVDENFVDGVSLRGDDYRWEGPGTAHFVHTYGEEGLSAAHFLYRSKALSLSVSGATPGRLVVDLVEPIASGCEGRLKFRVRVPNPDQLRRPTAHLEVGARGSDGEHVVGMRAGEAGLGESYGQVDVVMRDLGCRSEDFAIDEIFLSIADVDLMIDDLRVVVDL